MRLTYFGHSAFQIETVGTDGLAPATLLVDPFLTGNPHAAGVVAPDDLSPDVLLLTHAHGDHWGDAPAIIQRARPTVVAPFEVCQYVQTTLGHDDVVGMNTGGAADFAWGRLTNTYARHSSSFPDGTYGGLASGFVLHADGRCLYNTGDTSRFAEMAWIGEQHTVDVLLLPIGDTFTMGPDEAVECVRMIRPRLVVPLHYGTFPPIEQDPEAFAAKVRDAGVEARVLAPGETLEVA